LSVLFLAAVFPAVHADEAPPSSDIRCLIVSMQMYSPLAGLFTPQRFTIHGFAADRPVLPVPAFADMRLTPVFARRRRVRRASPTRLPDFGPRRPSIRCPIPGAIFARLSPHHSFPPSATDYQSPPPPTLTSAGASPGREPSSSGRAVHTATLRILLRCAQGWIYGVSEDKLRSASNLASRKQAVSASDLQTKFGAY
jgi:hypothetical protein